MSDHPVFSFKAPLDAELLKKVLIKHHEARIKSEYNRPITTDEGARIADNVTGHYKDYHSETQMFVRGHTPSDADASLLMWYASHQTRVRFPDTNERPLNAEEAKNFSAILVELEKAHTAKGLPAPMAIVKDSKGADVDVSMQELGSYLQSIEQTPSARALQPIDVWRAKHSSVVLVPVGAPVKDGTAPASATPTAVLQAGVASPPPADQKNVTTPVVQTPPITPTVTKPGTVAAPIPSTTLTPPLVPTPPVPTPIAPAVGASVVISGASRGIVLKNDAPVTKDALHVGTPAVEAGKPAVEKNATPTQPRKKAALKALDDDALIAFAIGHADPTHGNLFRGNHRVDASKEALDRILQQSINSVTPEHLVVDGQFGEKTEKAVLAFQKNHGISDSKGRVGMNTVAELQVEQVRVMLDRMGTGPVSDADKRVLNAELLDVKNIVISANASKLSEHTRQDIIDLLGSLSTKANITDADAIVGGTVQAIRNSTKVHGK